MRPASLFALTAALAVGLTGCTFLGKLFKNEPSSAPSSAGGGSPGGGVSSASQEREAELSEAHRRLAAELDAKRQEISDEGLDSTRALSFAELAVKAYDTEAVARGRIDGPAIGGEALGYLAGAKEAEPAATFDLALAEGGIHTRLGDDGAALRAFVAAFAAEPRVEAFNAMVQLPRDASSDAAVLGACGTIRPEIADDGLADFVGLCLDRSGGDPAGLTWSGAERDLVAYNDEMARREEAARIAEEERRKEEELAGGGARRRGGRQARALPGRGGLRRRSLRVRRLRPQGLERPRRPGRDPGHLLLRRLPHPRLGGALPRRQDGPHRLLLRRVPPAGLGDPLPRRIERPDELLLRRVRDQGVGDPPPRRQHQPDELLLRRVLHQGVGDHPARRRADPLQLLLWRVSDPRHGVLVGRGWRCACWSWTPTTADRTLRSSAAGRRAPGTGTRS